MAPFSYVYYILCSRSGYYQYHMLTVSCFLFSREYCDEWEIIRADLRYNKRQDKTVEKLCSSFVCFLTMNRIL